MWLLGLSSLPNLAGLNTLLAGHHPEFAAKLSQSRQGDASVNPCAMHSCVRGRTSATAGLAEPGAPHAQGRLHAA